MTLQLKVAFHCVNVLLNKVETNNILFIRGLFSMESRISGAMKHE